MNTIERLKKVVDDSEHCRTSQFEVAEAFLEEWLKLLAVVEAHKAFVAYCEDRFTWSAKPDEWEYITDDIELAQAKKAIAALEGD